MKSRILLALLSLAALLCSCSSVRDSLGHIQSGSEYYTQEYFGVSRADIISTFGAPKRETSDGRGGSVLVYERYSSFAAHDAFGRPYPDFDMHYRQFFMDDQDKCYRVMTNEKSPSEDGAIAAAIGVSSVVTTGVCLVPALIFALTQTHRYAF